MSQLIYQSTNWVSLLYVCEYGRLSYKSDALISDQKKKKNKARKKERTDRLG